jgi:poly(U)-specific endoribonuclease
MDIYQQIWDADQEHAGIKAISTGTEIDSRMADHGYVVVNVVNTDQAIAGNLDLLQALVIPDAKRESYRRVRVLFDNYRLNQWDYELNTRAELAEVRDFMVASYASPPMVIAKEYLQSQLDHTFSDQDWWNLIRQIWFEQFQMTSGKDLSGFEHVMVGEQELNRVQGYHFWYKYYRDQHFKRFPTDPEHDLINIVGLESGVGDGSPDIVRLKFRWKAFCHDTGKYVILSKLFGEFWVGPSAEGIMAMGIVRFLEEAQAPTQTVINGVLYDLVLYKSMDGNHLRTFYPKFRGCLASG